MLVVPPRAEVRHRPVETQRLVLTPVEPADAADLWNAVDTSRAHLEKWLPWVPFNTDLDASWRYCEASASDWDHARALRFTIRERGTKRFLGVVGLESLAHLRRSAELGYWLRVDGARRGYMTEAARATVHWAFKRLNAHRVRVACLSPADPTDHGVFPHHPDLRRAVQLLRESGGVDPHPDRWTLARLPRSGDARRQGRPCFRRDRGRRGGYDRHRSRRSQRPRRARGIESKLGAVRDAGGRGIVAAPALVAALDRPFPPRRERREPVALSIRLAHLFRLK